MRAYGAGRVLRFAFCFPDTAKLFETTSIIGRFREDPIPSSRRNTLKPACITAAMRGLQALYQSPITSRSLVAALAHGRSVL
jgi:hypothetical protein